MKRLMKALSSQVRSAVLALMLATAGTTAARAQVALSFTSPNTNSFLDGTGRMLGWEFTVDTTIEVTELGWFDWQNDGLATSHQIGIWNTAGQTLLGSVTVSAGASATLADGFRYQALGSSIFLVTGQTYRIAGFDPGTGGDAHVWDVFHSGYSNYEVSGFTVDPNVNLTAGDALGGAAGGFGYPLGPIGDERAVLMGPNFSFAVVPEASASALLAAGLAVLAVGFHRRRGRS
jgi:hypothetical protein